MVPCKEGKMKARDRKKLLTHTILCKSCGKPGGTLVKIGDDYFHQDKEKCRILQMRR